MPVFWLKPLFLSIIAMGGIHAVVRKNRMRIDNFVMGIVRDVGRYKAKKRRHQTTKGLIAFVRDNDPLEDLLQEELVSDTEEHQQGEQSTDGSTSSSTNRDQSLDDLPTYTLEELYEFGNGDGVEKPILIGILGRVYDVSSGSKFYGPGGSYGHFAGYDITYSLSTGCKSLECVQEPPEDFFSSGMLTESQIKEGQKWLSFFHLHDKYPLVGKLEEDPLKEILKNAEQELEREKEAKQDGESMTPPVLQ